MDGGRQRFRHRIFINARLTVLAGLPVAFLGCSELWMVERRGLEPLTF